MAAPMIQRDTTRAEIAVIRMRQADRFVRSTSYMTSADKWAFRKKEKKNPPTTETRFR